MQFTPREVAAVIAYVAITAALLLTYLGFFLGGLVKAARKLPRAWSWVVGVPVALEAAAIAFDAWRIILALTGLAIGIPLIYRAAPVLATALAIPGVFVGYGALRGFA